MVNVIFIISYLIKDLFALIIFFLMIVFTVSVVLYGSVKIYMWLKAIISRSKKNKLVNKSIRIFSKEVNTNR